MNKIFCGNALDILKTLPPESVNMCVTSPPYYGLRDYGVEAQIGNEQTPYEYIQNLLLVFEEVKRVLKPDGTLWVNIADSYAANNKNFKLPPNKDFSAVPKLWHGIKQKDIVAIYLRLSVDDKRVESMSIESQRLLLRKYAEILGDNVEIIEYVDNGYSGTNFERPAVQQLLTDVKTYKVNCILVKDFSRFGRNSIEVGYFTQQIFPLFGVRFISVSDNYDSDEHKGDTGGIAVAVKYLVNEYYSRDLSVKTKSAKYTKMRRGEYKSGNYTYGYKPDKNGEQIIDEKAAETVKMIFELTADGKSAAYISKLLFDKNIPTPAQYKGIKGNYGSRFPNCKYWSISTINRIIVNEQYMGMFVMLKQKVQDVGSTKMVKRDESEWIKIPNHHESIVSKELFERANAVRRTFKQPNKQQRSYPLRGKVECGCCQHAMDYVPKKTPIYRCSYTRNDETEP